MNYNREINPDAPKDTVSDIQFVQNGTNNYFVSVVAWNGELTMY